MVEKCAGLFQKTVCFQFVCGCSHAFPPPEVAVESLYIYYFSVFLCSLPVIFSLLLHTFVSFLQSSPLLRISVFQFILDVSPIQQWPFNQLRQ